MAAAAEKRKNYAEPERAPVAAPRRRVRGTGVLAMVNTGGQARHPGATERLMRYWAEGEGAAKIGWGRPGDFYRCEQLIQEAVTKDGKASLPPNEIAGLCRNLHKRATGAEPGHASGEQAGKH